MAAASVRGTSHLRSNTPCQDAHGCELIPISDGGQLLVLAACDGAGSAVHSDWGASQAANLLIEQVRGAVEAGQPERAFTKEFALRWIQTVRSRLQEEAKRRGATIRDFACTGLAAIVGLGQAAFLQVGDGAIVVGESSDGYDWVFWPSKGEFANETTFITSEHAEAHLEFEWNDAEPARLAVFTDGLERLILDFSKTVVHSQLLDKLFAVMESVEPFEGLCESLAGFLDLPQINSRTDDDKTLVLARKVERCFSVEPGDTRFVKAVSTAIG